MYEILLEQFFLWPLLCLITPTVGTLNCSQSVRKFVVTHSAAVQMPQAVQNSLQLDVRKLFCVFL